MPIDLARRLALEGLLSDEEFAAVVARRAAFGEPVPVALQALGLAAPDTVAGLFDRMGFAPASRLRPAGVVKNLPRGMLRMLWALPIGDSPTGFVVAMADPTDGHALAELGYHLKRQIDPRWAPVEALRTVLAQVDPPSDVPQTKPAPAPPPPEEPVAASRSVLPPSGLDGGEVLALVKKPPRRRLTPAYGEPAPKIALDHARAQNSGSDGRTLAAVGGAIGAFQGPAAPSSSGGAASEPAASDAPPRISERLPNRDSEAPIPLKRRSRTPPVPTPSVVPRDALFVLGELRAAADRDSIGRLAARGMTTAAQRAAFFVVKRGVVQGWEGATLETTPGAGMAREALRNLWIPVTAPSVFRLVHERGGMFIGPLSDATADSILAAALSGRPSTVLLAPIEVRGHVVAFLYADGLRDAKQAAQRAEEIVAAATEALERLLVTTRVPPSR